MFYKDYKNKMLSTNHDIIFMLHKWQWTVRMLQEARNVVIQTTNQRRTGPKCEGRRDSTIQNEGGSTRLKRGKQ